MKYGLTLSLFLGLISKDAAAMRLEHRHHHRHGHGHRKMAHYDGDKQDWVPDCQPGRDPWAQANGGAGTVTSYPGVGIGCQGFAQKSRKAHYDGDSQAWVDDCQPGRDPLVQADGQAGTGGSYPGVGIECQGFNKKKAQKLAQYDGDKQDWVDQCDPAQDPWAQKNPSGAGTFKDEKTHGSFPGVGVECQGFAQKASKSGYDGDSQAWVDQCDPTQDTTAQKNPSGAGTFNGKPHFGSYPGVGIECQGFNQKKHLKKSNKLVQYDGDSQAWIDDCAPGRDPWVQANGGAGTVTSYPGVGINCQGFAQKHRLAQIREFDGELEGDNNAWVEKCDPKQDTTAQKNPSGAGTGKAPSNTYKNVGVECMGFAQVKGDDTTLPAGGNAAWPEKCDPDQDTTAQKNPSGAGTHKEGAGGSFPGVGVDCQGFAQTSRVKPEKTYFNECPEHLQDCNGMNGTPGVDCC